jgi:hypothetical protein
MHKGDEPFDHRPISNDRNIGDRVNSREERMREEKRTYRSRMGPVGIELESLVVAIPDRTEFYAAIRAATLAAPLATGPALTITVHPMPTMTIAFAPPVIAMNLYQPIGHAHAGVAQICGSRLYATSENGNHPRRGKIFNRPNHKNSLIV